MRMPGIRGRGIRWLSVLFATSLATVGITTFVAPGSAWALGPGKVCMYLAPSGAQFGPLVFGHVGWEFQEPGRGYWAGATEDGSTNPPGTWITFSTSEATIHNDFKYAFYQNGYEMHGAGYYTEFRCHSTSVSAVGAAINQAKATATNGYTLYANDCLTKAASIYGAYDSSLDFMWAAAFNYPAPKTYFNVFLPAPGVNWGPIHQL